MSVLAPPKLFDAAYLCLRGGSYGHAREFADGCKDILGVNERDTKIVHDAYDMQKALLYLATDTTGLIRSFIKRALLVVEVPVVERSHTWEDLASLTRDRRIRDIFTTVVAVNNQHSASRKAGVDSYNPNGPGIVAAKAERMGYPVLRYNEVTAADDIRAFFQQMVRDSLK